MLSSELHWLPVNPNLHQTLRAADLNESDNEAWQLLVSAANSRLDMAATSLLDRKLQRRFGVRFPPNLATKPIKVAVLGSSTTNHLVPGIRVGALRRGLWVRTYQPAYGLFRQELMDRESPLHDFHPDVALFAFDAFHLFGLGGRVSADHDQAGVLDSIEKEINECWRLAKEAFDCSVIQQTAAPIFDPILGSNEHRLPGSRLVLTTKLNGRLRSMADRENVDLLALDMHMMSDGSRAWHDPSLWYRAKQEVSAGASPAYGDLVGRLLAAQQGRSAKCLVLDLDNTLWGGVIGDDGLEGIVLGQGSAVGEAFLSFQRYVLELSRSGIILAVCSKNDERNAMSPFESHPEMLLKRSDFACFVANWNDKVANLRFIAESLNLGTDSLVFADDDPAQRELIRQNLPEVSVPELPDDPALFSRCLADAGYFEALRITAEDRERAHQYQSNLQGQAVKAAATNLDEYLHSLKMELRYGRFDEVSLQRIVQLINKTNQFNLTTRRYNENQVRGLISDPGSQTFQFRLLDRFGDNGLIALVIGRTEAGGKRTLVLETWLMSCRVLGRKVEQACMNVVAEAAKRMGMEQVIGEYVPTPRNALVKDHYRTLGFRPIELQEGKTSRWVLKLEVFRPSEVPISVVESSDDRS